MSEIYNADVAAYLETVSPERRKCVRIMGFHVTMTYEGQGTQDMWCEWEPHKPERRDFNSERSLRRFLRKYEAARNAFTQHVMSLEGKDGSVLVIQ